MADKTIKNPLRKRILRDIRKEKGKYISIFLFLTFMISIVSGMLVTSLSMMHTYDDGIETYKLEDGHFSTNSEISVADLQKIADQTDSGTAKATAKKKVKIKGKRQRQREKEAKNPYAKYDRPKYYGR